MIYIGSSPFIFFSCHPSPVIMLSLKNINPQPHSRSALCALEHVVYNGEANRLSFLPTVLRYKGQHPLRRGRVPTPAPFAKERLGGRTFVVFIDSSEEGRSREMANWDKLFIPLGRSREIQLKFGMYYDMSMGPSGLWFNFLNPNTRNSRTFTWRLGFGTRRNKQR